MSAAAFSWNGRHRRNKKSAPELIENSGDLIDDIQNFLENPKEAKASLAKEPYELPKTLGKIGYQGAKEWWQDRNERQKLLSILAGSAAISLLLSGGLALKELGTDAPSGASATSGASANSGPRPNCDSADSFAKLYNIPTYVTGNRSEIDLGSYVKQEEHMSGCTDGQIGQMVVALNRGFLMEVSDNHYKVVSQSGISANGSFDYLLVPKNSTEPTVFIPTTIPPIPPRS